MKAKQTPIACAVAALLMGLTSVSLAQQAPATTPAAGATSAPANAGDKAATTVAQAQPAPSTTTSDTQQETELEKVEVKGIRASLQQSIDTKRNADTHVEVITAEDIGKMPDKNVADAIQRLSGVGTASSAAGEGGFDENDRVSLRGTSPSLTQTTINGHMVSSGDWFIQDQFQTVGRSVSYTLLPSEIVQQVIVHKTQEADMIEGGVAGSVDILTRRPLDYSQSFSGAVSIGGVYSDLPQKTEPQGSALVNWKNEAHTFGVSIQVFDEERFLRRDGQEFLGYSQLENPSVPALNGVWAPTYIGSALFEQDRKRFGGDFDIEMKPINDLTLDFNGFDSRMDATNFNRNYLADIAAPSGVGQNKNVIPTSYTVIGNTLTSATYPGGKANEVVALVDNIYRPGAYAQTNYFDLTGKLKVSGTLTVSGEVGNTRGEGATPSQPAFEGEVPGTGVISPGLDFNMNGVTQPASVNFPGGNPSNFLGTGMSWAWNEMVFEVDREKYAQGDVNYYADWGPLQNIKLGARYSDHTHVVSFPDDGGCPTFCNGGALAPTTLWGGATYPGNYGVGLNPPSGFLKDIWQLSPGQITAFEQQHVSAGPSRYYWPGESNVEEKDSAGYIQGDLGGDRWSGNVGLRFVDTRETSIVNVPGGSDPIPGSAFGLFTPTPINHDYFDVLPSLNLKYDLTSDQVVRLGLTRAMARPDYSALGGGVTLTDALLTGSGGNPNLKPILSNNLDVDWEFYYAPKSYVSVGVFYMDMPSYVDFGVAQETYLNSTLSAVSPTNPTGKPVYSSYAITAPNNIAAKTEGYELAFEQPVWNNFGVQANFTYANGHTAIGAPLVGASRDTYNVAAYYENPTFSLRLAYTYRSHFLVGLDRSFAENEDDTGSLALAFNYNITKKVAFTFDILNLNNPILKYYAENTNQPRAFYNSGRQYYFGVRMDF